MSVTSKKLERDTYEVAYAQGEGPAPITAVLTNNETGDVSNYQGPDDGKFLVTVAVGYVGSAAVEIRKSEKPPNPDPKMSVEVEVDLGGRKIDSGTVEFIGDAEVDNSLPPEGEIDNGLPEGPVFPNNDLPWAPAYPDVDPPYAPGRPDNSLPGGGHADNDLPWAPVRPDHDLPWAPAHPGNALPGAGHPGGKPPGTGETPDQGLPETPEPKA
jgi:hypothetical protein